MKNKKYIIIIMIIIIIITCFVIWKKNIVNKKYNIDKFQNLWIVYDQNMESIKNNMDDITYSNDEWFWFELKNFNIDDKDYQRTLNNIVSDIRMCYIENNDDGTFYSDSNPIKKYRNINTITNKELENLNNAMRNETCLKRFQKYSTLINSNNNDTQEKLLDKINNMDNIMQSYTFSDEKPTYYDLLSKKIIQVSIVNNWSSWLKSEYNMLMNN